MSNQHPLSPANIIAGLLVTILGGVVVAYLTKENKSRMPDSKQTADTVSIKSLPTKSIQSITYHPGGTTKVNQSSAWIYSTDSVKEKTLTYEGKVWFINKSEYDSLQIKLYPSPKNGNIYTLYLQQKYYHNKNGFSMPLGLYSWEVLSGKSILHGGLITVTAGFAKSITLLKLNNRDSF
ncbi:MAG: hypothetical protein QM737_16060 [Ferruginibacter sp.]